MKKIEALRQTAFEEKTLEGFAVFNWANLLYLSGVSGAAALLIPRNGGGILYSYGVNYEQVKAEGKGFTVELVKRDENLMAKIAEKVNECKVTKLAVDALSVNGWRALVKATRGKAKIKDAGKILCELRKVKDAAEIVLMQKAAELTSKGMKVVSEVLKTGIREYEVAAEIEYAMRKHGSYGTAFDTAVASGARSAFPHGGCCDREIRQGDLVVVDVGATYKFYRSDMTRTFVVGKPSDKQKKLYRIVKLAHDKAFEAMKPNVKARDVDAAARKIIEDAGYGECFVHGLGHGVGLEIHEPPTLNPSSKERLAAGNVVTDEPGIYLVDYGGVRIEDTVLVRENGAEKLTYGAYSLDAE